MDFDLERSEFRTCATMRVHRRLSRKDPEYRRRRREIEVETAEYIRRNARSGLRSGVVVIPVVVHVVYNTAAQNITVAQINSQIDVLNADFRRLNADAGSVPAAFQPVAADPRIEFRLAVRDPNCNTTSGITRTATTVTSFTDNDLVKSTAQGGRDAWPRDKYLNIWVCPLAYLGYAQFPGGAAATDGVVIAFDAFGTTGTAASPYNLGRTATHEIGHWLNLLHIWGDDGGGCGGTDNVADTPNQSDYNGGCPAFPHVSCGNGPDGDMFMNYMDYTNDACMFMFTAGQVARMDATLYGERASIVASDGLVPPLGGAIPDLWSKDTSDDDGSEPNASTQAMWHTDDIWVRRQNDGITNQEHQNPEYRILGSAPNYVYVRVRNRSCGSSGSGTVKLYWAKASTSLSWPSPWDGSVPNPALMGNPIGSQAVTVAGGDDEILVFPWEPPNPADYAVFGADRSHFCLLSRIETATAAPFGMSFPETTNLNANVRNNNNIVWKNITVVDEVPGAGRIASVTIGNFLEESVLSTLLFTSPDPKGRSLFEFARVFIDLGKELFEVWQAGGAVGEGVEVIDGGTILLASPAAYLDNFKLPPYAFYTVSVRFELNQDLAVGTQVFFLDVTQHTHKEIVGGQRFVLKTSLDKQYEKRDEKTLQFDGVVWKLG